MVESIKGYGTIEGKPVYLKISDSCTDCVARRVYSDTCNKLRCGALRGPQDSDTVYTKRTETDPEILSVLKDYGELVEGYVKPAPQFELFFGGKEYDIVTGSFQFNFGGHQSGKTMTLDEWIKEPIMITRDNYEGCDPKIAEELKNGKQVKGFFWDGNKNNPQEGWLAGYRTEEEYNYKTNITAYKHFSLTDPRVKKKIETRKEAVAWAKANPKRRVTLHHHPSPELAITWGYDSGDLKEYGVITGVAEDGSFITKSLTSFDCV